MCETTPGVLRFRKTWDRVYPAQPGYLFHDTEATLHIRDIQKAMWRLSKLYDNAKHVLSFRVNENTLVATFSTEALPYPRDTSSRNWRGETNTPIDEYLQRTNLSGWLIEDIHNPAVLPQHVAYNDLYDDCIMLERMMGLCPCPRLKEGTCFPDTAYKKTPWLADATGYIVPSDFKVYRTKEYKELDGFEYVSGQYATNADFSQSVRPWDNYDFSLVETRKAEFSQRGQVNALRQAHRQVECTACIFGVKRYSGPTTDCGRIRDCTTHATEEQVWDLLHTWFRLSPYVNGTGGFTVAEIEYLVSVSGKEHMSRAVSPTRNISTHLAGFYWAGGVISLHTQSETMPLCYRATPAQGRQGRTASYDFYDQLRADFPELPAGNTLKPGLLNPQLLLVYAILSTWRYIPAVDGHQSYGTHRLETSEYGVDLYGHTSRSTFLARSLSVGAPADDLYNTLCRYSEHEVKHILQHLHVMEKNRDTQPPQLPVLPPE